MQVTLLPLHGFESYATLLFSISLSSRLSPCVTALEIFQEDLIDFKLFIFTILF